MTKSQRNEWPPAVTPYIVVNDARRAIEWYTKVFGAELRGETYIMDDGSIGHAELAIGDGVVMLADEASGGDVPVQAPQQGAKHSHSLHVTVDDVDATIDVARAEGADIEREPVDEPYGRVAVLIDPFGHRWAPNQPPAGYSRLRQGDIGYITLGVPDGEKASTFYGDVLGWAFEPGSVPDGWQVSDVRPMIGIAGGSSGTDLCYQVDDVHAGVERVRKNGGTAGDIERKPYGLMADCVDNQGIRFQLWQPGS